MSKISTKLLSIHSENSGDRSSNPVAFKRSFCTAHPVSLSVRSGFLSAAIGAENRDTKSTF